MRWDRLFADLEGQADDLELAERDELVDELRDGDWAETSWTRLLGGRAVLEVRGHGRLEGEVELANEHVVHVIGDHVEHVVSTSAVLEVLRAERRAEEPTRVTARLGWAHVLRAVRAGDESVRLTRVDGSSVDGSVDVVGRDFVRLTTEAGGSRSVPFASLAIATLSGR